MRYSGYYHGFTKGNELLWELANLAQETRDLWVSRKDVLERLTRRKRLKTATPRSYWSVVCSRAKQQGLIETKKKGKTIMISFTDEGRRRILASDIRCIRKRYSGNMVCLAAFDFPEHEKRSRDMFRRFLKECGFTHFQKSVWKCDRKVAHLLQKYVKSMDFNDWVYLFEGKILQQ